MSRLAEIARRGRKAVRMPPSALVKRLAEEGTRRLRRPWHRLRPLLMTRGALLRRTGCETIDELWDRCAGTAFFLGDQAETARLFRERHADAIAFTIEAADRAVAREFDLLGSGPTRLPRLPWRTDFKSGREWPLQYCHAIEYAELDRPSDVKVPWELSRCQHFTALGQAYWLTGDERYAREFVDQVNDWIAGNPFAYSVNWSCAMDVALRAISWIWGVHFFAASPSCTDRAFRERMLKSLFLHGEFVHANIERSEVNGNHYLTDGVGLVFLGGFFGMCDSGRAWLAAGRQILVDEIESQVTDDGVDFEMSTAYHRLVLEAFLTSYVLLDRLNVPAPRSAIARLQRMCDFVAAYTKPDGRVPLVGDADDGRIQKLGPQPLNDHRYLLSTAAAWSDRADLKAAAGRFWEESFWLLGAGGSRRFDLLPAARPPDTVVFPSGGFYVLRGERDHAFVDAGEVGMRGRGGHGHNDILSFELFLDGVNVITDCGAYVYTASPEWRNRFRSTASHNVVQVDDEEVNRFVRPDMLWALHDDARPCDVVCRASDSLRHIAAGHGGYLRLAEPVQCRREMALDTVRHRAVVRDRLQSRGDHRYTSRFHFDPDLRVEIDRDGVVAHAAGRAFHLLPVGAAALSLERGWVSPQYGVKRETFVAVDRAAGPSLDRTWLFATEFVPAADRRAYADTVLAVSAPSAAGVH